MLLNAQGITPFTSYFILYLLLIIQRKRSKRKKCYKRKKKLNEHLLRKPFININNKKHEKFPQISRNVCKITDLHIVLLTKYSI